MSAVTKMIPAATIQDLWGEGYTIVPRLRDRFELPPGLIPPGWSYQWNASPSQPGWKPVPFDRHDGYFAPHGTGGDVYVGGLWLCEKPTPKVADEQLAQRHATQRQVESWAEKNKDFFGDTKIYTGDDAVSVTKVEAGKVYTHVETGISALEQPRKRNVELITHVPKDMFQYMDVIFAERDRLKDELMDGRSLKPGPIADEFYAAIEGDPGAPWWPTLHAILLPIAIANVRRAQFQPPTESRQ